MGAPMACFFCADHQVVPESVLHSPNRPSRLRMRPSRSVSPGWRRVQWRILMIHALLSIIAGIALYGITESLVEIVRSWRNNG
jgi:hypothetical protein